MIIETNGSIYEVRQSAKRFRRLHDFGRSRHELPIGEWFSFQRVSPVEVGKPVRFYWLIQQAGRASRIGLCETSPVVRVLVDEEPARERRVSAFSSR